MKLKNFLHSNIDAFAWDHEDMVGIDPKISCHDLKIDPKANSHRQKRRALNPKMYEAFKDNVQLIADCFNQESTYPR